MNTRTWNFIGRLIVPTLMMGAGVAYWASLLDARMREQNLILIQPVVFFLAICYIAIFVYEIRRFMALSDENATTEGSRDFRRLKFMAVAVIGACLFPFIGAIPATIILVASGLFALGVRSPLMIGATSVLTAFVLWLVFVVGFGMRMMLFNFF